MKLSKDFALAEMCESQTARRLGYTEQFNPPQNIIDNGIALATNILQPLREKAGLIIVTSWWRCQRTNTATGGAKNSQHLDALAADIQGGKISNAKLFQKVQELGLPFDQLIWEFGTKVEPAWVHVSFNPKGKPRKQILYIGI